MLSPLKLPLTLHRAFSLVKFAGQTAHCQCRGSQLKWLFRASREVFLFLRAEGRHAESSEAPSDASQSILPCQVCWSNCTLPIPGVSSLQLRCLSFCGRHAESSEAPSDASQHSLVKFAGQTAHCQFWGSQLKWLFRASREVFLFLRAEGRHAESSEAPSDASQSILPCQVCWSNCTLPIPGVSAEVAFQGFS